MKSNTFNYSLLAVGVAAVMGISNGVNAGTIIVPKDATPININNQATATYSVGSGTNAIVQPEVKSNIVTVKVVETGGFSLIGTSTDTTAGDDKNQNQKAVPGATTTFTHKLSNDGNVTDTYTIATTSTNDPNITTTASDYNFGTANVSYTIQGKNGAVLTQSQKDQLSALSQPTSGTVAGNTAIPNGGSIKLLPNTEAILSYDALTPSAANGNQNVVGTLSATSAFFTSVDSTNAKLVNENQAIVRLPTYKIVKTATSNVDLSVANPTIDYSITVTNVKTDYEDTATDFVIRDVLPAGMTLSGSVSPSTGVSTSTGTPQVIDIAVASLAPGASQVITFKVAVAKASYAGANASATNNAVVYDKFVGTVGTLPTAPVVGTHYDIIDSTDNTVPANNVTRVPADADQSNGVGIDTAQTTNFTNRNITLTFATVREIAPTTSLVTGNTNGQVTHQTVITNLGQDIEGDTAGELTFTLADSNLSDKVNLVPNSVTLVYNPTGVTGATTQTFTFPTNTTGTYDLNNAIPASGAPAFPGMVKGSTATINYRMLSDQAPLLTAGVSTTETTTITLKPLGLGAPTVQPVVTDTTNVKGLNLEKFQALDATCSGTVADASFSKDPITGASPDQCIIYRINATNTSSAIQTTNPALASGFNITALEIKDLFSNFAAGADFINSAATNSVPTSSVSTTSSTIAAPVVVANTSVAATASTLAPQNVATLTFKVKIKNAR